MGQRHQLFVIAKINGRYRNLCAIHHQWLYGSIAVKQCLNILKIFGDGTNRTPIAEELVAASKYNEDFWIQSTDDEGKTKIPFPFVTTCLIIGASFNIDGYTHSVIVEPLGMAYNQGDNNDGITVFDITDVTKVRYCFVDYHGMESKYQVNLMTPLSARDYLEAYYDIDDADDTEDAFRIAKLKSLRQKFEAQLLISHTALNETWPDEGWAPNESSEETDVGLSETFEIDCGVQDLALDVPNERLKTLRDRSLEMVLDKLLTQPQDNADLMAEAEALNDFIPRLRSRLYSQAADLETSSSMLHLLLRALEQDLEVDLRPFKNFTIEHLSFLFAQLQNGRMRSLNLSNMPELTEADLKLIIGKTTAPSGLTDAAPVSPAEETHTTGSLRAIFLMETPNISIDFLTKNLGHCDIYHSGLFLCPIKLRYAKPPAPALKFGSLDTVSQLVWVGVSSMQSCDDKYRYEGGQINWSSLKYSTEASSSYCRDTSSLKYKNFLLDVPLPAGKMIHSLDRLLRFITSPNLAWFSDWSKGAAPCFATISPQIDGSKYSVGPLSTTLYHDDDRALYVQSGKGQPLEPGRWAIVLVQEAFDARSQESLDDRELEMINMFGPRGTEGQKEWPAEPKEPTFKPLKRLRYVLAKALPESDVAEKRFLTTDVLGYLKYGLGCGQESKPESEGLSDWWKEKTSGLGDGLGYYEDDDIYEILDKIYPSEPSEKDMESRPRGIDPFEDIMRMMTMARQT